MIIVKKLEQSDSDPNSFYVDAFADTKEEILEGGEFKGLPKGAKMELGSTVMTCSGELAFMHSDGVTWQWQ